MIKSPQTEVWDQRNRLIATYPDFRYGTTPGQVQTNHGPGRLTVMTGGTHPQVLQVKVHLD
jgi:hypothetical protein